MTPLEAMIYILGPILIAVGIYALFLKRELDELQAQRHRETHSAE
ncbi:MAG TPA: hypothetical protein PLH31_09530 [Caulobacter sp.]|jgi:hypothetical protein|nr:hypothetical protein [Caulobacter sp.]